MPGNSTLSLQPEQRLLETVFPLTTITGTMAILPYETPIAIYGA